MTAVTAMLPFSFSLLEREDFSCVPSSPGLLLALWRNVRSAESEWNASGRFDDKL
jgi:hypothetical protein